MLSAINYYKRNVTNMLQQDTETFNTRLASLIETVGGLEEHTSTRFLLDQVIVAQAKLDDLRKYAESIMSGREKLGMLLDIAGDIEAKDE